MFDLDLSDLTKVLYLCHILITQLYNGSEYQIPNNNNYDTILLYINIIRLYYNILKKYRHSGS